MARALISDLMDELPDAEMQAKLQEVLDDYQDDVSTFVEFLEELSSTEGDVAKMLHRTHEPVPIEQFLEDDYFAGYPDDDKLWPEVRKMVCDCINGGYNEILCGGGIGTGKTTGSQLINAYSLYDLSTYVSPQFQLELLDTSSIVLVMLNRTDKLARQVTYGEFRNMIKAMPYFRERFPMNPYVEASMDFPKAIRVEYSAAHALNLLGKNVLSGIVDEMNFMDRVENSKQATDGGYYDQAKATYRKLISRRKSRFQQKGVVPGVFCVVSSKAYQGDFIEEREQEVLDKGDTTTMTYHKAQWEALPAKRFKGETFLVEVGDERHSSRLIEAHDDARLPENVLEVPVEYKSDFESDLEGSLQDVAGVSTYSTRPYFYNRERVWNVADMWEQRGFEFILEVDEWDFSNGLPTIRDEWSPVDPHKYRAVHIDLSVNRDRCGVGIGYVDEVTMVKDKPGIIDSEMVLAPVVVMDLLLTVKPPPGGEIEFSMIRNLLYLLSQRGLPIKWVTFDGFQSVDSRQILQRKGYKTKLVSVEGVEAYSDLREAIWQERILAQRHEKCLTELCTLEEDTKHKKVDHPAYSSKDTSDAMAGVYKMLAMLRSSWRLSMEGEVEVDIAEVEEEDTARRGDERPDLPPRRDMERR